MKRNILIFGLIAGLILGAYVISIAWLSRINPDHSGNAVVGYASMVIAFSFIYVGIRNFRDKYNQGVVSFGKAFRIGLGITLIGSTFYVITWLIDYYFFIPDFMDKYAAHLISEARASGLSQAALDKRIAEINHLGDLYKNPLFVVLFTYLEVAPVGVLISLFTAFIIRRKRPRTTVQVTG
jgi:hypothetical protein